MKERWKKWEEPAAGSGRVTTPKGVVHVEMSRGVEMWEPVEMAQVIQEARVIQDDD